MANFYIILISQNPKPIQGYIIALGQFLLDYKQKLGNDNLSYHQISVYYVIFC